jgi:predicted Zn-dependent protease
MVELNSKKLIDDAVLCFAIGEDSEAKEILLSVLYNEPSNVDALRAISEVCLSLQDLGLAETFCRRALTVVPDDLTSVVSLARILVKKGDKEGAEEASSKARILGWKEELASDDE